ncbi:Zinc finger protein zfp-1 [Chytridiales sp. JEL 0842]|nr:Zinc finger protein zfp-1 [Chytridiales sp. JEL 0842]
MQPRRRSRGNSGGTVESKKKRKDPEREETNEKVVVDAAEEERDTDDIEEGEDDNDSNASDSSDEDEGCEICHGHGTLLLCDGKVDDETCDLVGVHLKCYKPGTKMPDGDWFCDRCADGVSVSKTKPICCPTSSGAFRRTTQPNSYIHAVCALWNPHIEYEKEGAIKVENYLSNVGKPCHICNTLMTSGTKGLRAKCTKSDCSNWFHITCAIREGNLTPARYKNAKTHPQLLLCSTHCKESQQQASSKSSKHTAKKRKRNTIENSSDEEAEYQKTPTGHSANSTPDDSEVESEDLDQVMSRRKPANTKKPEKKSKLAHLQTKPRNGSSSSSSINSLKSNGVTEDPTLLRILATQDKLAQDLKSLTQLLSSQPPTTPQPPSIKPSSGSTTTTTTTTAAVEKEKPPLVNGTSSGALDRLLDKSFEKLGQGGSSTVSSSNNSNSNNLRSLQVELRTTQNRLNTLKADLVVVLNHLGLTKAPIEESKVEECVALLKGLVKQDAAK